MSGWRDRIREAADDELLAEGRSVLEREGRAVLAVAAALDERFVAAVRAMAECPGRILVTGLGKSGIVARKIAATLTGTGTPAIFVHPVEALHGDLGIASRDDLLVALSRSGGNEEVLSLMATLQARSVRCIAITTDGSSELARRADLTVVTPIEGEACPLGLSPTTSTTVAMAVGDALAMTLMRWREFRAEDFAVLHPSGALGRGLRLTVRALMHAGEEMPVVGEWVSLREALVEVSSKRLGCTCVVDGEGRLRGFLSDGDLRRILLEDVAALDQPVRECMSPSPRTVAPDCLAREALRLMETNRPGPITQLVVADGDKPLGILHIHDILRVGIRAD